MSTVASGPIDRLQTLIVSNVTVIPNSRKLSNVAERQMRNWAIGLQTHQRLAEQGAGAPPAPQVRLYVALSREAGAGALEIAELASAKTGWNVLDQE